MAENALLKSYSAPGVYIEETNAGPGPIESVATAVLAIVGFVPKTFKRQKRGEPKSIDHSPPTEPILVANWTEFTNNFGTFADAEAVQGGYLHSAVYGYFLNGGRQVYIVPLPQPTNNEWVDVTAATFIGNNTTGINALKAKEDVTMVACPDILAAYKKWKSKEPDGANHDQVLHTVQQAIITHCADMKDRIAILDMPEDLGYENAASWLDQWQNKTDTQYAVMYYPWMQVSDGRSHNASNSSNSTPIYMPPSGHIAGIYARVDSERGVHKAPGNEVVRGAVGLKDTVTSEQQGPLNKKGINCIRAFPGQGIRVWGARTLASIDDSPWRYINVRRLFCHIEDSILQSTRWVVFEPNDPILWAAIRRDITAYLTRLWRDGALLGRTPAEAFYVKCDAETNPRDVIQQGYCVIEVGIAPVRPAEFVVFQIGQWEGGGSATE